MSKVLKLEVNLKFSEKITNDDDIQQIVSNVLSGIMKQNDEQGISSQYSDTFVEFIEVSEPYSGVSDEISYV